MGAPSPRAKKQAMSLRNAVTLNPPRILELDGLH